MIWLSVFGCLCFSFVLSGLESAALSVSRVRLRHRAQTGRRSALGLERLFHPKRHILSSILLINNVINLVAFAMATREVVNLCGEMGYAISFAIALPVYVFWIELIPKSLFKLYPHRLLTLFYPLLLLVSLIASPLILVGKLFLGRLPWSKESNNSTEARNEFRSLADIAEREGQASELETTMIRHVLDFNECRIRDVMVPLSRVTAVPVSMPISSVVQLARETELEHFPVMSDSGNLLGVVSVFQLLRSRAEGQVLQHFKRIPTYSGETLAADVIAELRSSGEKIAAISTDGRPLGIASLHDLAIRMVGSA